ncbi:hypothetical protein REPUB_Repub13aG0071800 [Reevesia pubescens]
MDLTDLSQAGETGNIERLYNIIRGDAFILVKVDRVPFINSPLHQAASAGHIAFAMEIMNLKPSLAKKLNPDGFSPMHLALRNGYTNLILQLLEIDQTLVRVKGREGMTPFHYVAQRGNLNLIKRFLKVCPECIQDVTVHGETALHIAVNNDKVIALTAIVSWLQLYQHENPKNWLREVLNKEDIEGNTVLHAAVKRKQARVVNILPLTYQINKDVTNSEGLTALGIIAREGNHLVNNNRIMDMLRRDLTPWDQICNTLGEPGTFMSNIWHILKTKTIKISRASQDMNKDTRSALLVVAVLIITATYKYNSALNPPGGVWTTDSICTASMNTTINGTCSAPQHKPGTAIMNTRDFQFFGLPILEPFGLHLC